VRSTKCLIHSNNPRLQTRTCKLTYHNRKRSCILPTRATGYTKSRYASIQGTVYVNLPGIVHPSLSSGYQPLGTIGVPAPIVWTTTPHPAFASATLLCGADIWDGIAARHYAIVEPPCGFWKRFSSLRSEYIVQSVISFWKSSHMFHFPCPSQGDCVSFIEVSSHILKS
jgi:hypothetical protein